jgi:hypothetical protein
MKFSPEFKGNIVKKVMEGRTVRDVSSEIVPLSVDKPKRLLFLVYCISFSCQSIFF